ncbi:hypothetical protein CPB84DRAFT_1853575 [Gymnopilus junonius]|uniref:Uncharacterized protein n=1 Tax=Gymnopilus junonius TaxID=109634 RepID=A0A9P5TGU1_GYMJU|nr:hypothetical protein CPB84DRAFT_1853575 [Gymnopilus junonius]
MSSTVDPRLVHSKKRARAAREPSSDVEVVEGPTKHRKGASATHKRIREEVESDFEIVDHPMASKPRPNTPEFDEQPAVTITAKNSAIKAVARKLSFGDIPAEASTPRRDRKPSQRAKDAAESEAYVFVESSREDVASPRKAKATTSKEASRKASALSGDAPRSIDDAVAQMADSLPADGILPRHGPPAADDAVDELASMTASESSDDPEISTPVRNKAKLSARKGKAPAQKSKPLVRKPAQAEAFSEDESDASVPRGILVSHSVKSGPSGKESQLLPAGISRVPSKVKSCRFLSMLVLSLFAGVSANEPHVKPDPDAVQSPSKSRLHRKDGKPISFVDTEAFFGSEGDLTDDGHESDSPSPVKPVKKVSKQPGKSSKVDVSSKAEKDQSAEDDIDTNSDVSEDDISPDLAALHEADPSLPRLKRFAVLKPYRRLQQSATDDPDNTMLLSCDAISKILTREASVAYLANSRLMDCAQGFRSQAVFMTSGAVAECKLHTGAKHGFGDGYQLKKILLCPFNEDHPRTISFLGTVANFDDVFAHWVNSSLLFSTRKEGPASPGSTPAKKASFFVSSNANGAGLARYPASLAFSDTVPIYDGRRKPFLFLADDLDSIKNLPIYRQGRDLPVSSIVTLGYTFNTFNALGNELSASFNIQFVIYLGGTSENVFQA